MEIPVTLAEKTKQMVKVKPKNLSNWTSGIDLYAPKQAMKQKGKAIVVVSKTMQGWIPNL